MDTNDFEGTLVLEKLVVIEKLDEFFEAIDGDDFETAKRLMKVAKVDAATIEVVLRKMSESDESH